VLHNSLWECDGVVIYAGTCAGEFVEHLDG